VPHVQAQTNFAVLGHLNQVFSSHVALRDQVILGPSVVKVRQLARVFLDSGSHKNYMAEALSQGYAEKNQDKSLPRLDKMIH